MGCSGSKPNVIIDISYCGGCGWTQLAKSLCQSIKKQLPQAIIDCRPQQKFTGFIQASLIVDKKNKQSVYKGDKQNTLSSIKKITSDITKAYDKI